MTDTPVILIVLPIFILVLAIIYRTIKESLKFSTALSAILSICVTTLALIGLSGNLKGMADTILIPYETLAICILVLVLIAFVLKTHKKAKDRLSDALKKDPQSDIDEKRIYEIDDDRMRR